MINDAKLQDLIKWHPHPGQQEILNSDNRDVVICAGRRFGKSAVCGYVAVKTFLQGLTDIKAGKTDSVKIWIVAPTYELSKKVFEYVVKFLLAYDKTYGQFVSDRPNPQVKMSESVWIQCKSAETPNSLLGEELNLLIIDECSRIKRDVYETYLYPTTLSRKAKRFFISTPFGKNWFYEEWMRAKPDGAFQFSSLDGVSISQEEWELAKKRYPSDVFEQEFQAVFREKAAAVFRGVRDCIGDCLSDPLPGHNYLMGLDLAKFRDFTVLTTIDRATHKVVHFDRFHRLPYTLQKKRIIEAQRKYSSRVIIDRMNVGAALSDELKADGLPILDITATRPSKDELKPTKERLIEKLSVFIEDRNITLPPIDILIDELESFGYQITDAGNWKYSAPEGLHDDCVMSLAMAVWLLKGKVRTEIITAKKSIPSINKIFQYK